MNDSVYKRIEQSPRFKELVAKRDRFAWILPASCSASTWPSSR